MSKDLLILAAVVLVLAIGGRCQPPANLVLDASYSTSPLTSYGGVIKIQVRIAPRKGGAATICVGILANSRFEMYSGEYAPSSLTVTPLAPSGGANNIIDFSLLDKGSISCEHVALTSGGGLTYDYGDTIQNPLSFTPLGPLKISYTTRDYSNNLSDRLIYMVNNTGGLNVWSSVNGIEWAYVEPFGKKMNSVSVVNNGANSFGVITGFEGAGVAQARRLSSNTFGTYIINDVTSYGARIPSYTAMSDGQLIYCYDNGQTIAVSSKIYCGSSSAVAGSDVSVADNALYTGVQVSPVQSSVAVMTASMPGVNRLKLVTFSTTDMTVLDSWVGTQTASAFPAVPIGSHAASNIIALAYIDPSNYLNIDVYKYTYIPPLTPSAQPVASPIFSPVASPIATPTTTPATNPVAAPATPTTTAPIASPLASPTAVPIDGPIAPVSGPSPVSSPVKSPASNAPSQAGGVPTAPGPSPSDNVGGTPQAQPDIGTIVGVVVACVVGLGVGVFLLVFFLKKKQRKQKKKGGDDDKIDEVPMTATSDEPETYGNIPGLAPNNKYSAMTSGAGPSSDDGIVPANIQPSEIDKRLHIPHRSLVFVKEIGAGSYGKVYLGEWRGAKVAIKVNNTITDVDGFLAEAKLTLGIPPHPNLVQTFGVSLDGPNPCIVLEYCGGGSLDQLFKAENGLTNKKRVDYALKIAYGLAHLHSRSIVHRDLAARNILLTNDGQPKISDFGMSRIVQEEAAKGRTKTNVGPIRWMAPESLQDRSYSLKTDVWTYGVMLFEIVSGKEPHEDEDQFEIALKIRDKGFTPEIPEDCDPVLRECMEMCWKRLPADRPTMEDVCDFLRSKSE